MAMQRKEKTLKGKASGFDNDADFIPFELSDDDVEPSRPESRMSNLFEDSQPSRRGQPQKEINNDIKKRKRKDIESSPERGPSAQRQKVAAADLNPWQTNWDDYASLKETARMLHKEVLDFSNWVSPTSKEVQVRAFVAKRVADSIETFYPQCRAYPFGSFSTKLYTPDADIDMVVDYPGHIWSKDSMRRLGRHIERSGVGRSLQYIFGAKVPIIKFVDTYARIDLDLAFNQSNALQVVKLVQQYLQDMPAVRPLVMILKTVFQNKNLSVPAEGGLGSYSIICMVISFLQRHPKIAAGHIVPEDNLGAMLLEILELYGNRFNFDRVGIAIDDGGAYFEKLDYQLMNQNVWKKICIRDPNDRTNNIAKASHQSDAIIRVFYDAFTELTRRCYLVHAKIQAGEEPPWGTKCGSLLDSIIEKPRLVVRDRLKRAWKKDMEGVDSEFSERLGEKSQEEETIVFTDSPKKKKMPTRKERRAAQMVQKKVDRDRTKGPNGVSDDVSAMPPPSPRKKKGPTSASGTKDTPITLDDSSPPPSSPRQPPARTTSPSKRKNKKGVNSAATNLQTTGSITGTKSNAITLD